MSTEHKYGFGLCPDDPQQSDPVDVLAAAEALRIAKLERAVGQLRALLSRDRAEYDEGYRQGWTDAMNRVRCGCGLLPLPNTPTEPRHEN